jgi:RND superfamily putative drug exporter
MQAGMDRLAGFLQRRRSVVLVVWIVALVGALPFAAKQTDHLTSGGFEVSGSQSQTVSENIHRFEGAQRDNLAVVLARRPGAATAAVRAEVDRVGRIAAALPHVELTPRAAAAATRDAGSASITVVPLAVQGDRDQAADMAVDFRDRLIADGAHAGVQPYLVGQQALWAGMQDLTKDDLASAERIGFPVVLIILLAVFGSLAAAALPLALGFGSVTITGAVIYFLSQATPCRCS